MRPKTWELNPKMVMSSVRMMGKCAKITGAPQPQTNAELFPEDPGDHGYQSGQSMGSILSQYHSMDWFGLFFNRKPPPFHGKNHGFHGKNHGFHGKNHGFHGKNYGFR